MSAFVSDPANISLHDSGWYRLKRGSEVSRMPLFDTSAKLFARVGWKAAAAWLKSRGWRLPSPGEIGEMADASVYISPVTLPDTEQLEAAGIRASNTPAVNAYRNSHMRSLQWCQRHDTDVLRRLEAAKWDGEQPVYGAGKHWTAGGGILGWYGIQPLSMAHQGYEHTDYATTVIAARDVAAVEPPDGPDSFPPTIKQGSFGGAVTRWQRLLVASGAEIAIDSSFGPATDRATRSWQRTNGLHADGVVGPVTWSRSLPREDDVPSTQPRGVERLPARKTTATAAEVYAAIGRVWARVIGGEPSRESRLVLLAQWAHETGIGRAMWNYNFGNAKTAPGGAGRYCWTFFSCSEVVSLRHARRIVAGAGWRSDGTPDARITSTRPDGTRIVWLYPDNPGCCFRAFRTLDDGAADYLRLMHTRFRSAWPAVEAGDTQSFAELLRRARYYTDTVARYSRALRRHYSRLDKQID